MLKQLMHRFWQRAPRRLRTTRAGRILLLIALAAGLAALNTGNNLLFFGWGMVLSAIVVSGVLSEATLRYLHSAPVSQPPLRAAAPGRLSLHLCNGSRRMPAFGLDASVDVHGPKGTTTHRAPYAMRLAPKGHVMLHAVFTPEARGAHALIAWAVSTAYPFGFFEKSRRLQGPTQTVYAAPRAVPVGPLLERLVTHFGELASGRPGQGEDFFALRPFRQGDDGRRINWRRSARTGRLVLVEHEAVAGREVLLELRLDALAPASDREAALCVLCSLAEALLGQGLGVGIYTAAVALPPARGPRQAQTILQALARLDTTAALPRALPWHGAALSIALVGPGALRPPAASGAALLQMDPVPS